MIRRCYLPTVKGYEYYGARGIRVCSRWLDGEDGKHPYMCFLDDMGEQPSPSHSLDRIDVNGNYEPGNCRWATVDQQQHNTRRSIHADIGGVKVPMDKYAARLGFSYESLRVQVRRKGRTVTEAARYLRDYHARAAA